MIRALLITPKPQSAEVELVKQLNEVQLEVAVTPGWESVKNADMVMVFSPSDEFLSQVVRGIRSDPALSLTPLLALANHNGHGNNHNGLGKLAGLIDASMSPPLSRVELRAQLSFLTGFQEQIACYNQNDFSLTSEGLWLSFLRFVKSRRLSPLQPQTDICSRWGYIYPQAATLFNVALGEEVSWLEELEEMHFLRGEFFDRIHLCPHCSHFQLNFREICPQCRSPQLSVADSIHHYRCGYVGLENEFLCDRELICPKCHKQLLHIGVEYERSQQMSGCCSCHHLIPEPEVECLCLQCGEKFPSDKALIKDVKSYYLTPEGIRAAQEGVTRKNRSHHYNLGILSFQAFKEIFIIQQSLAQRYGRPLSLLAIKTTPTMLSPLSQRVTLETILTQSLRGNDLITLTRGGIFLILCGESTFPQVAIAVKRLKQKLSQEGFSLISATLELTPDAVSLELLVNSLRQQLLANVTPDAGSS